MSFPVPEYKINRLPEVVEENIQKEPAQQFNSFAVQVNGQPVPYSTSVAATIDNRDITALLASCKVPVMPVKDVLAAIQHLSPVFVESLKKEGALDRQGQPCWFVKIVYYWTQRFPTKSTITVEHSYV